MKEDITEKEESQQEKSEESMPMDGKSETAKTDPAESESAPDKKKSGDKKFIFEKMPINKALLTLAIPTVISQLISLVYNMVDAYFIGRTGNAYMIAGISLSYTLWVMMIAFANLFGVGGGSFIARLLGAGKPDRAKVVSSASFYGALFVATLYGLAVFIFMNPLLNALGASETTILYAKQYTVLVVILGAIPSIVSMASSHFLRNVGYAKQASIGLSMGGVLNMILDPIFMFVLLPDGYEVVGAALATLLSNIVSLIYLILTIKKAAKTTVLSLSFHQARQLTGSELKKIFSVGVPSALLPGLYDLANMVVNSRMALHGDFQVAALGVVMKIERLPNAIGLGISQGMQPLVAYNYAAKNFKRMKEAVKNARIAGICICVFLIILYEIFAVPLCNVFVKATSEEAAQVLSFAVMFIQIRILASLPQFFNYHTSYCMQAVGDGFRTLLHTLIRELVLYIPMIFLLDSLLGELGINIAFVAAESMAAAVALIFWGQCQRKRGLILKKEKKTRGF